MNRKTSLWSAVVQAALLIGCSGTDSSTPPASSGGANNSGTGGATNSSGASAIGGTQAATGGVSAGGAAGSGGAVSNTGGTAATGGAVSTGGVANNGGSTATGGTQMTGGATAAGGTSATGGTKTTGGTTSAGGTSATGGAKTTGGATGTGGTTSSCPVVTPTACTSAPTVRINEIDVGATVVVNEDDADLKLLSISPIPSGGSRVAWMGSDSQVHITTLDCNDNVVSTFGLPAMDYGDIYADNNGGVLLVARDAQGGGTLNCGKPHESLRDTAKSGNPLL